MALTETTRIQDGVTYHQFSKTKVLGTNESKSLRQLHDAVDFPGRGLVGVTVNDNVVTAEYTGTLNNGNKNQLENKIDNFVASTTDTDQDDINTFKGNHLGGSDQQLRKALRALIRK